MTLVGRARAFRYATEIGKVDETYRVEETPERRADIQLEALNQEWTRVLATVPYYADLRERNAVPQQFRSLEEFAERTQITTRADVRAHLAEMTSTSRPPEFSRMTGGSTAEPVQLPAWNSEVLRTRPDTWLGRGWYGVTPSSRLFLFWGHSHLLGSGYRGWLRKWRVRVSDSLLGYRRFSAYDLRPDMLRLAAHELLSFRPEYMIGYSVALDLFARHNEELRTSLRAAKLKVVIGTSESFPSPDSASRLADLFGCPVGMEYGAVETGLMAHTRVSGGYAVFWRTYLLEAIPHAAGHRLLVTSLYPRCFPLVRYDLGDEVVLGDGASVLGLSEFDRLIGRCNDYVVLGDGAIIHSEVFTHAVRACAEVRGYQIKQTGDQIRLGYLSASPPPPEQIEEIRRKLGISHRGLEHIAIERVSSLERTIAGKTPMVIRSSAPSETMQASAPPMETED